MSFRFRWSARRAAHTVDDDFVLGHFVENKRRGDDPPQSIVIRALTGMWMLR